MGIVEAVLALVVTVALWGIIIGSMLFVAYTLVTMKRYSSQQTELLREIKELLEKLSARGGPDDVF